MSSIVRACLITNPRSGRGGIDLSTVLPVLKAHGWDISVKEKLHGGMATDLAREAAGDGCTVVVGCGGDGTLSEIVEGLTGTDTAVGAIPGGTVNQWAQEVGISRRLDVAARQLVGAVRRKIDVGHVTVTVNSSDGAQDGHGQHKERSRHFMMMAGLGLDGAVMARLSKPLKNRIGRLAVGVAAIDALASVTPVDVRLEIGETLWQGSVWQIVVGNTRRYGGFTSLTPDAYADDGLLDVCLLTATGPVGLASQAAALLALQHPDARSAEVYRAGRITVHAPTAMPLQLDGGTVRLKGEPAAGGVTYTFNVIAQGVTVLVPATYHGDLFRKSSAMQSSLAVSSLPGTDGSLLTTRSPGSDNETKPHKDGKAKRRMRVVAVGTDTITAARIKDGHVFTLLIEPDTSMRDVSGRKVDASAFLSMLSEGAILRVKGEKDRQSATIKARRIALL